ncbi:MAG: hypothetical protein ACYC6Y_17365 [Thermoguttaceae bacterium]
MEPCHRDVLIKRFAGGNGEGLKGKPFVHPVTVLPNTTVTEIRPGNEVVLLDRMRRPLAVTNPNDPPVIQSAWDDERGTVGVFAANTEPQEVMLKVPAPGPGTWRGTFYVGDAQQQVQTVAAGKTLQWPLPSGRLASTILTPE